MSEELIEKWFESIVIGHYNRGRGCGRGYGWGNDSGNGYADDKYGSDYGNGGCIFGYVSGAGYNNGCGDGSGYGVCGGNDSDNSYGVGNGCGKVTFKKTISKFNKYKVYRIYSTNIIFTSINENVARGFILKEDFTLEKSCIVKQDGLFGRGFRIKKAKGILNLRLRKLEELQGDKNE